MEPEIEKNTTASKDSFLMIIDMLAESSIRYWVEGGWGVDVLIGKQTREHRDIDIDFDAAFEDLLMDKLNQMGYQITTDCRPTRVELYHPLHGYIDIHPFIISTVGDMKQANPEGGWFDLEANWFSKGTFEGRIIPCVSVEGQKLFHNGYELREIDKVDLERLNDTFPQTID